MAEQVVLEWSRVLAAVEQAHTHWQAQLRALHALLALGVKQVDKDWACALVAVQPAHTPWQAQYCVILALLGLMVQQVV